MIFEKTPLLGAFVIHLEPRGDSRGFFARSFCRREFEEHGLNPEVTQCNVSQNGEAGTLRGMHYQRPPHEEAKLVRCTRGALWDVALDLRPDSPSYLGSYGIELTPDNRLALYVPEGCAHGYQTLVPDTEAFYLVSSSYAPEAAGGVRWDDPAFGLEWPDTAERVLSEQDRAWPDYTRVDTPS